MCLVLYYSLTLLQMYRLKEIALSIFNFDTRYQKNLTNEHISFCWFKPSFCQLNRFKPHVWQKQDFAGRIPTLVLLLSLFHCLHFFENKERDYYYECIFIECFSATHRPRSVP